MNSSAFTAACRFLFRTQPSSCLYKHQTRACSATPPKRSVSSSRRSIRLRDAGCTETLGRLLGVSAQAGDCILLHGELGAGKTSLARGFVRAVTGDSKLEVPSPSFVLVHEYPNISNDTKVFHLDLWRLKDAAMRPIIDFGDIFTRHISLIEWPERLGKNIVPPQESRLDVFLEYNDDAGGFECMDSSDDPWGFESSPDDSGRIAKLRPTSAAWKSRIDTLVQRMYVCSDGLLDIPDLQQGITAKAEKKSAV